MLQSDEYDWNSSSGCLCRVADSSKWGFEIAVASQHGSKSNCFTCRTDAVSRYHHSSGAGPSDATPAFGTPRLRREAEACIRWIVDRLTPLKISESPQKYLLTLSSGILKPVCSKSKVIAAAIASSFRRCRPRTLPPAVLLMLLPAFDDTDVPIAGSDW